MFDLKRNNRLISLVILVFGVILLIQSSFSIPLKTITIIIFFVVIQIVSFLNFKRKISSYKKMYYECDLLKLKKCLEKMRKENKYYILKSANENLLLQCYLSINEYENAKDLFSKFEKKYEQEKESTLKIYNCYRLAYFYLTIGNYDKSSVLTEELSRMLKTVNLDYVKDKQEYLNYYFDLKHRISAINGKDKKELENAEKYFLDTYGKKELISKVCIANLLVTIYEKLDNIDKAQEYAEFVIKNHKDYYINPKRIAKYNK